MTMDDNDIFESLGGSLLNDLLADLNAAAASQRQQQQQHHSNNFHNTTIDDNTDDLFALLEQELISTYKDPPLCPSHDSSHAAAAAASASSSGGPMLPGRNHVSAAMVVNQQHAINSSHNIGHAENNGEDDVWSNSLSQFGNMSLAADFLAADSAKKQQTLQQKTKQRGNQFDESLLFEQQGDYLLEEDVVYGNTAITALLGGTPSTTTTTSTKGHPNSSTETASGSAETTQIPRPTPPPPSHPPDAHTVMVPPPSHMTGFLMPAPPPPSAVLPPPQPMILNQMLLPPMLPVTGISGMGASSGGGGAGPIPFDADNFPALGSTPEERRNPNTTPTMASAATMAARPEIIILNNNNNNNNNNTIAATKAQIIFNNTNPHTPPISAHLIQSKLMPFRDVCFIVNVMMRTLKCLDAYNDDYYHWSVLHRRTKNFSNNHPLHHHQRLLAGGMPPGVVMAAATPAIIPLQPTPLSRGIKETVKGQEEAFQKAVKERAKTFAEEQKSLGQLVKTNVKRPKALLDTPVLKKEEDAEGGKTATASSIPDDKYEAGRQVGRIRLWKARVTIDGGYAAFLSLMELRRLIQAQVRGDDPRVIQDLMVDVKSNIDLLHSSLGVSVQVNSEGSKTIEIDERRLGTTLSLSKGRILCARSIEEGIVPHPTACNLLPAALRAIFSEPMPSEGEDRLLRAFTGLILTENPGVHPEILCSCLEVATSFAARGDTDDEGVASSGSGSNLTSSHTRMNLMHGLLSMGKHVCAGSPLNKDWLEREQVFRGVLNLA